MNAVELETPAPRENETLPVQPAANRDKLTGTPARPRRRKLWVAGAVLFVLCLCAGVGATLFGAIYAQKEPVEASIDAFMQALDRGDIETAYGQFSARGKLNSPKAGFREYFSQRANKVLADGYQEAEVANINVSWTANSDVTAPQGQVAQVDGTLYYAGGYTGSFAAVLEREGSEWRIYGINITVPPQKFEDYLGD